jgi:hypothetical protein
MAAAASMGEGRLFVALFLVAVAGIAWWLGRDADS